METNRAWIYDCGKHKHYYAFKPRAVGRCYCGEKLKVTDQKKATWINPNYGR